MSDFADRLNAKRQQGEQAAPERKRRSLLPSDPPAPTAPAAEQAAWLTVALGLGCDPVASATRYGRHREARMVLTLRSGQRVTFERCADAFDPRRLVPVVIVATGAEVPHYTSPDAQHVASAIVRLSDLASEHDERIEAREWADSFLAGAEPNTLDVTGLATAEQRWEAFNTVLSIARRPDLPPYAPAAERSRIVRCQSGERLVRTVDVATHVRGLIAHPISWPALHSRMVEIGWEHPGELQQRHPGGHGKVRVRVYLIPPAWSDE